MFTKTVMRKDERGFTLIELLIVIAIIAILAAIAIPQFSGYRERAARASMVADSRNAATVLEAYFTDYGSYGPTETRDDITGPGSGNWPNTDFRVKASRGNTLSVASITASSYTLEVANAGGAGTNKSPLSLDSTGTCTFNDGSNC
ncbi:MAG: prepilin-type N-terminal cleavage/methylation domain-containing protein [Thermodesulfobacteriota bacterium]